MFELQNRRQERRIISANKAGDNKEHCQFETETLSDRTKEKQSHRDGGGTSAHKLTYWWAKMIVFDIIF